MHNWNVLSLQRMISDLGNQSLPLSAKTTRESRDLFFSAPFLTLFTIINNRDGHQINLPYLVQSEGQHPPFNMSCRLATME